jgi:site-specific DNA-methyltransferase (adenine-specific)
VSNGATRNPAKNGRPTARKSGKVLTVAERCRRYRAKKKARLKAQREALRQARCLEVAGDLNIHRIAVADIEEHHLASGSVDLVCTDPPYGREALPVYRDLAGFAMRVLKPSGWCIAFVGSMYLPEVLDLLRASGLVYRWQFVATFSGGAHARIAAMKVFQAYKSVLVLQKPPLAPPREWHPDVISVPVSDQDKDLHMWQAPQSLFVKLIERFTVPGDLVCDPLAGSGTTVRAALGLGRRAWGADREARGRLLSAGG